MSRMSSRPPAPKPVQNPTSEALQSLFPAAVCFALRTPGDYMSELSEQEKAQSHSMGSKRLHGYSAGRAAAKEALSKLGVHDAPVLIGEKRKPVWPEGVCGSISHCKNQCIAVVATSNDVLGIGVDVEQLKPLNDGVQKLIMTTSELEHIQALDDSVEWGCVLFSIKESLYKCLNPITGNWINFHQAEISLQPDLGECQISLDPTVHNEKTRGATMTGRFLCTPSHVYSAVTLK